MIGTLSKLDVNSNKYYGLLGYGFGSSITGSPKENPSKEDFDLFNKEKIKSSLPTLDKMFFVSGYDGKWYRTNVVVEILDGDFNGVLFVTLSGSFYKWEVYED